MLVSASIQTPGLNQPMSNVNLATTSAYWNSFLPDARLSTKIPHLELQVLVSHRFHVETNSCVWKEKFELHEHVP